MPEMSIRKKSDAQRNADLVEKIFKEHEDFIRSIILFNVKNEAEAEDLF